MPSLANWIEMSSGGVAVAGAAYAALLWIKRRYDSAMDGFSRLSNVSSEVGKMSTTITNLTTNHLPHIQSSLDQTVKAVGDLAGDVKGLTTDLKELDRKVAVVGATQEDTKSGLHTLGQAFLNHLENASREQVNTRANVARHELQIDAILQAEQVKQNALVVALATPKPDPTKSEGPKDA